MTLRCEYINFSIELSNLKLGYSILEIRRSWEAKMKTFIILIFLCVYVGMNPLQETGS